MPQDGPQKAPGGPTMPQDSHRDVFLRSFLAGVQNHTCFYVSAVVSTPFAVVSRHGYFLHAGGLLAGSYVKTRAASDGAEMASV